MNRIDRLTAILIHLQTKRVVKAQELADRFEISLRTVYRDVRALEEAGVPIGAEAGIGYFLEDYHLPPVMLSNAEASALLFGAKLIEKMADQSLREPFASALFKIRSVLKRADKEHLADLEAQIAVSGYRQVSDFANPVLNTIQGALVQQRVLYMGYRAGYNDETVEREVEPVGLVYYGGNWHLIAWCRLRQDYRDFRTDRMAQVAETGRTFSRQDRLSLQAYLQQLRERQSDLQEVVVLFDRKLAQMSQQQRYSFGYVSEELVGEHVRMRFITQYMEGLGRWLLMYGNGITIESPEPLRFAMRTYVEELQSHYLQPAESLLT
ncbi:MAG: YafY family transcriptional regulator [Cytophagales bacterium]|nr:MAG: YafY family transcriptional regulator [Cytophagales bacterium]